MTITCKNCDKNHIFKRGFSRGKQRYCCKDCGYHFVVGDKRNERGRPESQKALALLLYAFGKSSYETIAKLLKVSNVAVYKWIKAGAKNIPEPTVPENNVRDIEFDEMWHFIQSKKTEFGSGKHWIELRGELSPGLLGIVILKRLKDSTKK